MSQRPFVYITDAGMEFLAKRPPDPLHCPPPTTNKPVNVAVRHDLSIELHGEHFSVSTQLTADQALSIISMLAYVLREGLPLHRTLYRTATIEVTK